MANKKIIDTGLVEFILPFNRGGENVCEEKIYFNPNDIEFFYRLTKMIENLSEMYEKSTAEYQKSNDDIEKLEILHNLSEKVKSVFDFTFGNNVSDGLFKYVSPVGIVNRTQYYPFYILDYLMPLIEKETGKTSKATVSALKKAMNKHTAKYAYKFQ
jgi:hypothetical protein